jgi:hypothetical protein
LFKIVSEIWAEFEETKKVSDILEGTSCKRPEGQKLQEIDVRFIGGEVERSVSGPKLKAARGIRGPTASV